MVKGRALLLAAMACLWLAPIASAQETGSISGAVFDSTGSPVADALVRVSGALLPAR
jgi:protocatechuate 3,4-dioxygenase beta subunit